MRPVEVELRRGRLVESIHAVSVAVHDGRRGVWSRGDAGGVSFLRSCAKPFQALAVLESGAAEAYGLHPEELAVICGSHGAEPMHVRAVRSILRKAGIRPSALRCGAHAPTATRGLRALYASRGEPSAIHNNCSGKHSGMLAAAKRWRASLTGYLSPGHPVQKTNLANVARNSGVAVRRIPVAIDGCSAPTFGLPLFAVARMGAALASAPEMAVLRASMMAHPAMVGRPCVSIMTAAPGRLVTKGGAEGLYLCGVVEPGLGIALKVADGASRPIVPVLVAVLRKLRLGEGLDALGDPVLRNHAGRVVGTIKVRL